MAQRQFRSDDTDAWKYAFGKGTSGDYTSAGNLTIDGTQGYYRTSFSGTANATSGTLGGAWTWNGLCMIHQTRGTGVGNWEFNWIVVSSSTAATFLHPLMNTYTTSGNSAAQIITILQWKNFTVGSGHTLTIPAWDGAAGGIFPLFVNGTVQGVSGGNIVFREAGFRRGALSGYPASTGEGSGGPSVASSTSPNYTGGGGGQRESGYGAHDAGGAGGGSHASVGGNGGARGGTGATLITGNAGLTNMTFGGAGGTGGGGEAGTPDTYGAGGIGAGCIVIVCKTLDLTNLTINGVGGDGQRTGYHAGGAGGAGGSILFKAQNVILGTNKAIAYGGSPAAPYWGSTSGAGGVGRIHLDYKTSYSGSTNPGIDVRQDLSLNDLPSSNFFAFFN